MRVRGSSPVSVAVAVAVVTAAACAGPVAARGRSEHFAAERYGCELSGLFPERSKSIWSGSYARGMSRDEGSPPEGAERAASLPAFLAAAAGEALDPALFTSRITGGVPVALVPYDTAPLEVLLPRVGAAVARHHRRLAARHGLTPTAVAVLAALDRGDVPSHRDLAARIGLSPATLTPVLDGLEKTGDVRRERNRRDRRVVHVHRTAAGAIRLRAAGCSEAGLPRPVPESEQAVRTWLLAVLRAAEADG